MVKVQLMVLLLVVSACSSTGSSHDAGAGGSSMGGSWAGAGGSTTGAGGALGGRDGSAVGSPDVQPNRPFWCPEYKTDSTGKATGWVSIGVVVMERGRGGMTSPIEECQVGATDWSVSAKGTEKDGIDETAMTFRLEGRYAGPGVYHGGSAQGIVASLSHSDLGSFAFAAVSSSECQLCINDDGLSGTVSCWGLEAPAGEPYQVALIYAGSFTCPGATPKPADAPVTTSDPNLSSQGIVCHYAKTLDCAGRPADDQCIRHSDGLLVDGPCRTEWSAWLGCIVDERPSTLQCASGDTLRTTTGACDAELSALDACRVGGGSAKDAGTGTNTLADSPECDAFCAKLAATCGRACDRSLDCIVYHCPVATRTYLSCAAQGTALECDASGYLVRNCFDDLSLCD